MGGDADRNSRQRCDRPLGHSPRRSGLCASIVERNAMVHDHRSRRYRSGDRRDNRGVLSDRLRPDTAAAVHAAGSARQNLGNDAWLLVDGVVGAQLPRLEGRGNVVRVDGHVPLRRADDDGAGRAAAIQRHGRERRPVSDAGCGADPRPHLPARGRP